MECRFKPLGCTFTCVELSELSAHETDERVHAEWMSFSSIFHWLGEHRHLKHQLVMSLSSQLSPPSQPSPPSPPSQSSPSTPDHNTQSVPYVVDHRTWVSIVSTTVYADESDPATFPTHLVEEKTDSVFSSYRPLKYPSLVVENGSHNSIVVVRVRTNGWRHLQLGWMNHHGTYLRRLIPGTRVNVTRPSDSDPELLFELVDVKILHQPDPAPSEEEENHTYEADISFKVRDMTGENRFEGHYRDLRVVAFCLESTPRPVIRSYDVGMVMRTSPNASYLSAKRVPSTEVELGWNQAPVVPPMMGVRPTMRMDVGGASSSPLKRKKLLSSLSSIANDS